MTDAILEVSDVWASYGKKPVLVGVSLGVDPGEVVAVLGHNGAGKSTVLKTIVGLLRASKGEVRYRHGSLRGRSVAQNMAAGVVYVCQGRNVFPDLTVQENIDMGLPPGASNIVALERHAGVHRLFPRLAERAGQKAGLLSGGEQQMVALGRALMAQPSVLLLDEPSLGLSPAAVIQLFTQIQSLAKDRGMAILMVEQKTAQALDIADRGYIMRAGRIALEGSAADLRRNTSWYHLF